MCPLNNLEEVPEAVVEVPVEVPVPPPRVTLEDRLTDQVKTIAVTPITQGTLFNDIRLVDMSATAHKVSTVDVERAAELLGMTFNSSVTRKLKDALINGPIHLDKEIRKKAAYNGAISKRVAKWFYKEWDIKLEPQRVTDLGNALTNSIVNECKDRYIRFTTNLSWYPGDFGDHNSCYWSCHKNARWQLKELEVPCMQTFYKLSAEEIFEGTNGTRTRYTDSEGRERELFAKQEEYLFNDKGEYVLDDNGEPKKYLAYYAADTRCWVFHEGSMLAHEDSLILWNGYSMNGDLPLPKQAAIVATCFGYVARKHSLGNYGERDHGQFVNSSTCQYLTTQERMDAEEVRKERYFDMQLSSDYVEGIDFGCSDCGYQQTEESEDRYVYVNSDTEPRLVCDQCYTRKYAVCPNCDRHVAKSMLVDMPSEPTQRCQVCLTIDDYVKFPTMGRNIMVARDMTFRCSRCMAKYAKQSERSNEACIQLADGNFSEENMDSKGNVLCDACVEHAEEVEDMFEPTGELTRSNHTPKGDNP